MNTLACRSIAVAAAVAAVAGCPRPDAVALRSLTHESATARVLNVARRIERMGGVLKARLPGVSGMVASVDLDVALEPADRVSVAVRSFFDQPMQVLVTDGITVTVFDATSGAPIFFRGPVTERTLQKVLPLPLWPQELVEVILARPPLNARGRLLSVDESAGTYRLRLEAPGHGPIELTVRADDDAILEWRQSRRDGRPLLNVSYKDHRKVGDTLVAHAWTLTRLDVPDGEVIEVTVVDATFNGPAFPPEAFALEPPPGTPIHPL
jgi:hypothetical protein